ncbi:MAG: hypothetical protein FWD47_13175 [Treponema sp.]|nr:hypothetical protein [Treponema sp.]
MKKTIITVIMLLAILAIFGACESKKAANPKPLVSGSQTDLNVQYVRIGYGSDFPTYTIIDSREMLNHFHFSRNISNISLRDSEFLNAISKYTDSFFTNNFLVIICLNEPSGSNRHKVEKIDSNGDIIIKQLIPEIGTADMATWLIFIELKNSFKLERYRVVLE